MTQGDDVPPLSAFTFGQNRRFAHRLRTNFFHQQAHSLERRSGADDIVQQDNPLAFQDLLVFFINIQRLRLPGGDR